VQLCKLACLLLFFALFLVAAAFISVGIYLLRLPRPRVVSQVMRSFTTILRVLLNVRIDVQGAKDCLGTGGYFIISNHLGYLDGIVLGSLFPVIFVTKREVKQWPVIGQLLMLLGTIFVDRLDKKEILPVLNSISQTLREEANVLLFPEGTSTDGEQLAPFQSAFFAAPLLARASIVPMTLSYRSIDRKPVSAANRDRIYWYGDMSFVPHLWDLLGTSRIEVSVKVHPAIETSQLQNNSHARKQLSHYCQEIIARGVRLETEKSLGALQLVRGSSVSPSV
jgi:1-acyl-sn-glycerol-3-phosphate acyltransferase